MQCTRTDQLKKDIRSIHIFSGIGIYTTNIPTNATNKGSFIFRAAYRDKGPGKLASQLSESIVILRNPYLPVDESNGYKGFSFNNNRSVATSSEKGAYLLFRKIDLSGIKTIEIVGDKAAPDQVEARLAHLRGINRKKQP